MRCFRTEQKRLTAFIVLFALICAQIAISAHAVLHPDHNIAFVALDAGHNHDHDQKDDGHSKHKCPECLLAKSFQSAFVVDGYLNIGSFPATQIYFSNETDAVQSISSAYYQPRAPPAFLI